MGRLVHARSQRRVFQRHHASFRTESQSFLTGARLKVNGELTLAVSAARACDAAIRSRAMLQKFVSVHAQIHNHFNLERHLLRRADYKQGRAAALAEWRALAP
jgi:hypothetical protein